MRRLARCLLLVLALLSAQQGALLHALEHAAHEAGIATLGHETEECVAYDAVGHALGATQSSALTSFAQPNLHVPAAPFLLFCARVVFDSRAPPYSA